MNQEEIIRYKELDDKVASFKRKINVLMNITPRNKNGELDKQMNLFFKGDIQKPKFVYRKLKKNHKQIKKELESLDVPDGFFKEIYEKKINEMILENEIILNRGKRKNLRKINRKLYGYPENRIINYANKILDVIGAHESDRVVESIELKEELEKDLREYGLKGWRVEFSDKWATTVYPDSIKPKISVCKKRKFSLMDKTRLKIHEIGVHVLRSANGNEQPLRIFSYGLSDYLCSEEGLASFLEEVTGNIDHETLRNYAGRIIAVKSVADGEKFRKTFDRLKDYGFGDEAAWNLTVRVHRGGGYWKDQVYLKGYRQIEDFFGKEIKFEELIKEDNFKILYSGKIGLNDIEFVKKLLDKKLLKEAKFLPRI
jgi:uncharacterized protein (TIGR02421 family)